MPAASVAVVLGDEIVEHAVGVLSTATGVAATTDSIFQIGSITKVWTATLVMQLVDEGRIDLDVPLREYLPEFGLEDENAAEAITVRHLLSHRAGFEGDIFTDTGRGDDAIEKYVELLADAAQTFAPGTLFSYNNAGFVVLGRLVESILDTTWEKALVERIAVPIGARTLSPSPYEAILHRAAVGHVGPDENGVQTPAPFWVMARSNEPAGSMLAMSARDLALFARAHLRGGDAEAGSILSPESAMAMRSTEVRVPEVAGMGAAWGLGWEIDRDGDAPLFGHDGNTVGQSSFLRIAPEAEVAVVLLTNGGDGQGLLRDVVEPLLQELTGSGLLTPPVPAEDVATGDIDAFLGRYADSNMEMEIVLDDEGRVWLEQRPGPVLQGLGSQPSRDELVRFRDDALIMKEKKGGMHLVLAFLDPAADGRSSYVHFGRAVARSN